MKITTMAQFDKVMAEAQELEKKIKSGKAILREEYKFSRMIRDMKEFMANVRVVKS